MSNEESQLFHLEPFDARLPSTGDPDPLHTKLGVRPNQFVNASRLVVVELETPQPTIYTSTEDTEAKYVSPRYAEGTDFAHDFTYWNAALPSVTETLLDEPYTAYAGGFPRLLPHEGGYIDCLHVWTYNSAVLDETFAIPFTAIRGLYVHSKFRTDLGMDLEEVSQGTLSRFEIPQARYRRTNEVVYAPATVKDIQSLKDNGRHIPEAVVRNPSSSVRTYTVPPEDHAGNYFDIL